MQILYAFPIVGAIIFIIGLLSIWSKTLKSLTSFPIGPKWGSFLWIGVGIILGALIGLPLMWASITSAGSGAAGSLNVLGTPQPATTAALGLSCYMGTPDGDNGTAASPTFIADPNDRTHYTATIASAAAAIAVHINGTVTCNINNPGQYAGAMDCAIFGGSFRNQGSTSDQNLYYILATGTTKSLVPGLTYQQTAYLKDGSEATTSDNQEVIPIVIANDQSTPTVQEIIGYDVWLTTYTQLGYLNNQNSVDTDIKCDTNGDGTYDKTVGRLTITKIAA